MSGGDLDIYAVIDGTDGLTLNEANGYLLMAIGPGARVWRRITETSPFTHGEEEIHRTLAPGTMRMTNLVLGSSISQLNSRLDALIAAVEQSTYNTSVYIDGVLRWKWACRCADTVLGDDGGIDARRYAAFQQILTATAPRHPIQLTGPA